MMDYLKRGVLAMSRAYRANTMSGHFGAPLLAVELLCHDQPDLPSEVVAGLHHELDLMMAGDESWFNEAKADVSVAELFADADLTGDAVAVDPIAEALGRSVDALRQSGHNVIFAALSLRALELRPELATAEVVDGIVKLMDMFVNTGPGRVYLGAGEKDYVDPRTLPLDDDPEPYVDETDMARRTIEALQTYSSSRRRGLGDLHHVTNHAAAIVDLRRLGYDELAKRARPIQREHVRRYGNQPDLTAELGPREQSPAEPLDPAYWAWGGFERGGALLSHRPKTIYGFETIAAVAEDAELVAKGRQALRFFL